MMVVFLFLFLTFPSHEIAFSSIISFIQYLCHLFESAYNVASLAFRPDQVFTFIKQSIGLEIYLIFYLGPPEDG